jgi:hypothetical protein
MTFAIPFFALSVVDKTGQLVSPAGWTIAANAASMSLATGYRNPGSAELRSNPVIIRAVESDSEGILGGVGVGKNVPTPTSI